MIQGAPLITLTLKLIVYFTVFYAERSVACAVVATVGISTAKIARFRPNKVGSSVQTKNTALLKRAEPLGLVLKNSADSIENSTPWEITVPKLPINLQMMFLPAVVPRKDQIRMRR